MDSSGPFRVEEFRVKRARPFKSVDDVRKALRDYKEGRSHHGYRFAQTGPSDQLGRE
jgi:hypothetical protein